MGVPAHFSINSKNFKILHGIFKWNFKMFFKNGILKLFLYQKIFLLNYHTFFSFVSNGFSNGFSQHILWNGDRRRNSRFPQIKDIFYHHNS